jgi:tripartite-type tricarboxylate transporter receptor subunit TctC
MARAQAYPTRLVRLIVPFGSSGPTDITGRIEKWAKVVKGSAIKAD